MTSTVPLDTWEKTLAVSLDRHASTRKVPQKAWRVIAAAREGSAEALGVLYDLYVELVYAYHFYWTGDHVDTQALTAATFHEARERILESARYRGDPGRWLIRLAREILSNRTTRPFSLAVAATGDVDSEMLEAVRRLSPGHQELLTLRFLLGMTLQDVCIILDIDRREARNLQAHAIIELKAQLPSTD